MPITDRDIGDRSIVTEREIAPTRTAMTERGDIQRDTANAPDQNYVVSDRYLAPIREPLQRGVAPRSMAGDILSNSVIVPDPIGTATMPFGDAFSNFLGGGGSRGYDQPIAVVPGDSGGSGLSTAILIVLAIAGIGVTYYLYKRHKGA